MLILSMLFVPFRPLGPGENRGGPPGAGFGVGKGTIGMGRTSSPGVLRLRAPSAVSCDESVRRFAQDDDFVGVLKKRSRRLALMGRQSWVGIEKRNESRRDD